MKIPYYPYSSLFWALWGGLFFTVYRISAAVRIASPEHVSNPDRWLELSGVPLGLPAVSIRHDGSWGASHPGWPQKGLIGNSRFNRKIYEK